MTPLKFHNSLALLVDAYGEAVTEYESRLAQAQHAIQTLTHQLRRTDAVRLAAQAVLDAPPEALQASVEALRAALAAAGSPHEAPK